MRTCAVLPVKHFDDAKQRLDRALNAGTRRALAEAMVSDVLHALRRSTRIDAVVVVTGESGAAALARAYDAEAIGDDDRGHSQAALAGVAWALERDFGRALLVPGDCPALEPGEVDELVSAAGPAPDVTIVADRHGTGTNALLLGAPDVIAPSFGPGSRERHERAAEAVFLELLAQHGEILTRVDVEQQRRWMLEPAARAAGIRQRAVAPAAVRAEARGDHVGRGEQQPVGARAVAVGDDHDLRPVRLRQQQPLHVAGVQRRAVSGHTEHPLKAIGQRALDAERDGGRLARGSGVGEHGRAMTARRRSDLRLVGDYDRALDRRHERQRVQHVEHHRAREL